MLKRALPLLWLVAVTSGCHASYAVNVRIPVSSAGVPDLSGTWNSRAFEGTWGRKALEDDGGTWSGAR
jgi:hypothetical protein